MIQGDFEPGIEALLVKDFFPVFSHTWKSKIIAGTQ
jgi:hypothetical protein